MPAPVTQVRVPELEDEIVEEEITVVRVRRVWRRPSSQLARLAQTLAFPGVVKGGAK